MAKEKTELSTLTDEELEIKLVELKQELFGLRFQHTVKQLENTSRLKAVRKDIARVKTYLRQREIAAAQSA